MLTIVKKLLQVLFTKNNNILWRRDTIKVQEIRKFLAGLSIVPSKTKIKSKVFAHWRSQSETQVNMEKEASNK